MEPVARASPAPDVGVGDAGASAADTLLADAFALFTQRRDRDALPRARVALAASPLRADAWTLLGILEQRAGRAAQAEAAYRAALRLRPGYVDAWTNLGNLLRDNGDRQGCLRAFQRAMQLAPRDPEPIYNLGVALEHFGDWAGSLAAFEATVECDPSHVDGRWNNALALLRHGRFEEGFRDYEARLRRGTPGPRPCPQPVWDGTPLAGRTILVWAEQGFGDALQFLRFVPEVAARGGRVVLEVGDSLRGLASRIPGIATVSARGAEPPPFDTHVALMSLPFTLGLHDADIPSHGPYLHADAQAAAHWRARLRGHGWQPARELAAGLVWATHPALRTAAERSPGLQALRPLLDLPGVRWFGLQKGPGHDDVEQFETPANFVDLDSAIADFDDTAAIIANLDMVVTCDTSVAHLAGAMGKPTFTMLPFTPDWRHGLAPCSTPWYPGMRLFRQPARGDWSAVRADVAAALSDAIAMTLPIRSNDAR